MKLINKENKLTFILNLDLDYGKTLTGGIVALHMLAYKLAERGHIVYTFTPIQHYPHKNIYYIPPNTKFTYDKSKTIVIYKAMDKGNPLNIPNVTRWLLYDSDKDIERTWGKDEIVFNFNNFSTHNFPIKGKLTAVNFYLDTLYNKNLPTRKGFCHILHKDTPNNALKILKTFRSKDVGNWKVKGAWDYLQKIFNDHRYFLTFDNDSFYTVAAGLCGCIPIILNDEKYSSPEEYRETHPTKKYGVAYGMNDLDWALSTSHLFHQNIYKEIKKNDSSVDQFISYWNEKLSNG